MKKIIILCATLCMLLTAVAVETGAEVRVRTRADGAYDSISVVPGGPPWKQGIWGGRSRIGLRRGSAVLNPLGDRLGDLIPTVAESSQSPHHPWAVWSRFNGTDYDLVYASWTYAWSRITPVAREGMRGDDLDPSLAFTREGNPMVAWWNRDTEQGTGTVYFSLFAGDGWVDPIRISSGRHPQIMIEHGALIIRYQADDGTEMMYTLDRVDPATITDDIDPQTSMSNGDVSKGPTDKN